MRIPECGGVPTARSRAGRRGVLPRGAFRWCAVCWGAVFAAFGVAGRPLSASDTTKGRETAGVYTLYVSLAGEERIAVFTYRDGQRRLSRRFEKKVAGRPGCLTFRRDGAVLFAALRGTGKLASYAVDSESGRLTLLSAADVEADPAYVRLDRTEKWLFSAYYRAGRVMVHAVSQDGRIASEPTQVVETAKNAHAIEPSPDNRFVLVPHTGPNRVYQFRFHPARGRLSPNSPPWLQMPPNTGPRHVAFHPRLDRVYFDNEQGSSVTVCRFDRNLGLLTPMQTLGTLPDDFAEPNTCAHLELSRSGRYCLASNRGHDSVAVFRVDELTGRLRLTDRVPCGRTPRGFNLSADERLLAVAGQGDGTLTLYRFDAAKGRAERLLVEPVGKAPWWVTIR
ncbi:MAG: lactonase family protein [Planctomycetota bacterium]|nr:MAG: lactonase family protein [Planctomycetota bacterium]